jgi:hypothetical protein
MTSFKDASADRNVHWQTKSGFEGNAPSLEGCLKRWDKVLLTGFFVVEKSYPNTQAGVP